MIRPVVFIDSGIGGLPYCRDFLEKNHNEEIFFIADREHFPLGPRKKEEVAEILISLTEKLLKKTEPKIIVLACNTATVSALDTLRQRFPGIPFVGTVPAIKPAALATKTGIVGVLGTERTIEDPISRRIVKEVNPACRIFAVAAPDLVEFIEHHLEKAGDKEKTEIVKKYTGVFRGEGADTLVLGCTHFLHLLDIFRREADSSITIFESLDGITKRVEFLLDENGGALRAKKTSRAQGDSGPSHKLIITGNEIPDSHWITRAKTHGFNLCLFDNL